MKIGAIYAAENCQFVVWAPLLKDLRLKLVAPEERIIPMSKDDLGYWHTTVGGLLPGALYYYSIEDARERPDPASHFQPEGVHGPSGVIDHESFRWDDDGWKGVALPEMIMYELHAGAFTPEGTFDSVIARLPEIKELGVNAIEIMPVAQFPGERNWGYDGAYPFSVQNSYGGVGGLKRLVNDCHRSGIAVILDVVYNHLGPEGNYLREYGPYFTDKYRTPWGWAINFDDEYSNEVRNFFIENALYWFRHYHIDALRLDAIHGISDLSSRPFLQELADTVSEFSLRHGRKVYLLAESDLNDTRVIRPKEVGGCGIDGQWCDDFHHSLHALLTGEKEGYYRDFGTIEHLDKSMREGFVYSGQYSAYRKRDHGNSSKDIPAGQFVVFSQNHDQVGNRMFGERLSGLISFEALKLAAGAVLLSPYIPLLFMGEEYGEDNPFLYFVSHTDPHLVEAVRKGRETEFRAFLWKGELPDPQDFGTFRKSKIEWEKRQRGRNRVLLDLYRTLIRIRKESPCLSTLDKELMVSYGLEDKDILFMRRWKDASHAFAIFNFDESDVSLTAPVTERNWSKVLDSSDIAWEGPGSLLPGKITRGADMKIRGLSFALFMADGAV
jgi:maltooligosyltrehalose trehalohydrolase